MNKTDKMWKRIGKCLRSKKWGQYRYAKGRDGSWVVEHRSYSVVSERSDWSKIAELKTEKQCISTIASKRLSCIKDYSVVRKRKWKYIP